MTDSATYIACLTPPGSGAIATLGLYGPDAWNSTRQLFRPRSQTDSLPGDPEPGRFWLGRVGNDVTDEAVLSVKRSAPVPWLELHCHGGREVIRLLVETFQAHGVKVCEWPDFERLTAPDALRAAAAIALAAAPTTRTAAILLDQYHGAFERTIKAVLLALQQGNSGEAGRLLPELVRHVRLGRHLTTPWRVVVAGAANVGKSSLVNALAGFQRSIVSAVPGTTRDVVNARIAIDGWSVEISDTAGVRAHGDALEEEGINQARTRAAGADLCLWVLDAAAPPVLPETFIPNLQLVVNKIDLPAAWLLSQANDALHVSALTGSGIQELCQAISTWLAADPPPAGAAVPFTPWLCDQVEEALNLLSREEYQETRQVLEEILK